MFKTTDAVFIRCFNILIFVSYFNYNKPMTSFESDHNRFNVEYNETVYEIFVLIFSI